MRLLLPLTFSSALRAPSDESRQTLPIIMQKIVGVFGSGSFG